MTTHSEQLLDKRWQKKRLKILERDNWKCTCSTCNSNENTTLDVHHLDYINGINLWDYPDDLLITLCRICHKKEQNRLKEEKYLLNTLRMNGFLIGDLLALSTVIDTNTLFKNKILSLLREFQY